jgi:hypothetical protein
MNAAHLRYGYTLKEIADYLTIRYTAARKVIAKTVRGKKRYLMPYTGRV